MTLRERCEAAAKKIAPCTCIDDYKLRNRSDPRCIGCAVADDFADAIESEARAFAEAALRQAWRMPPDEDETVDEWISVVVREREENDR